MFITNIYVFILEKGTEILLRARRPRYLVQDRETETESMYYQQHGSVAVAHSSRNYQASTKSVQVIGSDQNQLEWQEKFSAMPLSRK